MFQGTPQRPMTEPLVSVGLPVRNGERHLAEAVESLLAQEHASLELIISDNASSDGTAEICQDFVHRDERVRFYRNDKDVGQTENLNRVFRLSSGDYFMWAAHDDYWEPQYVRRCLERLLESDDVVLVGTEARWLDEATGVILLLDRGLNTVGCPPQERFRRYRSSIHSGSHIGAIFHGLHRREALAQALPLVNVVGNDHLLLAKLCLLGEIATVPEPLMTKRRGGASANYAKLADTLRIQSPVGRRWPMLTREFHMQRLILGSEALGPGGRVALAAWSAGHYLRTNLAKPAVASARMVLARLIPEGLRRFVRVTRYVASGRRPWSVGYGEYRERRLQAAVRDRRLLQGFRTGQVLPPGYGIGLDERAVEYPWVLARLERAPGRYLLDAGGTLNYSWVLRHPRIAERSVVVFTAAREQEQSAPKVEYAYGDLRRTGFERRKFDEIVCISTLEHIGMDNSIYTEDPAFRENNPDDYLAALGELKTLLKPGGRLLLTVPFGRYQDLGWMQQFDGRRLEAIQATFAPSALTEEYFRYTVDGWQRASAEECEACEYHDVRSARGCGSDGAAAARAVACLELTS